MQSSICLQSIIGRRKIGTMLPCNVIVQEKEAGRVVISAIVNPTASMQAIENKDLQTIANEISVKLQKVTYDL